MSTSKLIPDLKYIEAADDSEFADAFARIESHYFVNGIFLEEGQILRDVEMIAIIFQLGLFMVDMMSYVL